MINPNEFHNRLAVDWARRNLAVPVEIKLRLGSRLWQIAAFLMLFIAPLLFIAVDIVLKINEVFVPPISKDAVMDSTRALACGLVLLFPSGIIAWLVVLTRMKFAKTLESDGVEYSFGRKFLWENLYYIDHVSKHTRVGEVSRVFKDNQLELVFADGKAIIPPFIKDREQIWKLINSIPAPVKDDGKTTDAAVENLLQVLNKG